MRDEIIATIEQYFDCLKNKTIEQAPFAADITFNAPTAGPFEGKEEVVGFFQQAAQFIVQAQPKRFIVDGEYTVVLMDLETVVATLPVAEAFHVVDGEIKMIRPYYDPRPLLSE